VIQDAVAIRRDLIAASPDRYRPYLATALNNLASALRDVGREAKADATQDRSRRHQDGHVISVVRASVRGWDKTRTSRKIPACFLRCCPLSPEDLHGSGPSDFDDSADPLRTRITCTGLSAGRRA
jgi:hypothetical protein